MNRKFVSVRKQHPFRSSGTMPKIPTLEQAKTLFFLRNDIKALSPAEQDAAWERAKPDIERNIQTLKDEVPEFMSADAQDAQP